MAEEKLKKLALKITLKNVKQGFGHDLAGLYCDVFMDGKKVCYLNDDGWGGEVEIAYASDDAQKKFEKFLVDNKVAQLMFDDGWGFMKSVDKIDLHTQAESIINLAVNVIEQNKFQKKIEKECLTGIVFGTDTSYRTITYKLPLKAIIKIYKTKGIDVIQNAYDRAKSELKAGERIFNTNLEELDIKL